MRIRVEKSDYRCVSNILVTFAEYGYFNSESPAIVCSEVADGCFWLSVEGVRDRKSASLVGDVLESALGKHIEWFDHTEYPDAEDA